MLIIPAIDIVDGKCVRLKQGDYSQVTRYRDNPVKVAQEFVSQGAEWIHVVDLDGAESGSPANLRAITQIVVDSGARIQFGGGLRSIEMVSQILGLGVHRVVLGSMIVKHPELARQVFSEFGDRIVAGLDVRHGKVAVEGWTKTTDRSGLDVAQELERWGASRLTLTDIGTDGMLSGPNLNLLTEFAASLETPIIASGGVGTIAHLVQLSRIGKVEAAIVGTAIYEGRFTLDEAIQAVS